MEGGREERQGEGVISAGVLLAEEAAHHAPKGKRIKTKTKPQYYMQGKSESFTRQVLMSRIKRREHCSLLISLESVSVTLLMSHSRLFHPAPLHLPITNQQQSIKREIPTTKSQPSISC